MSAISKMKPFAATVLKGTMKRRTEKRIRAIAAQLNLSEAEAVEWAVMRCGLRIRIPSKFYPEF